MPPLDAGRARALNADRAKLPGARALASPRAWRAWLQAHAMATRPDTPIRLETLKLRPGRRLTVRMHVGRSTFYVKVYRPERARSVEAKYLGLARLLAGVRDLRLPRLRAADPDLGIVVWESFGGTALLPTSSPGAFRRVGRVLARVHATRLPAERIWTPARELEVLAERLADAPAATRSLAPVVASRLTGTARPRTIHRDFYADQVLIGRRRGPVAILDWDDATLGPPALDVGNALAHLELAGLRAPRLARRLPDLRRAFLDGYRTASKKNSEGAWRIWEGAALLRLSGLAWSRRRGRDPVERGPSMSMATTREEAELLAGLAEQRLGGGKRGGRRRGR